MVQSKLNRNVTYPETKRVLPADENKDLDVYESYILGIPVTICIGKLITKYRPFGIYAFPIYLVKPNDNVVQIGIFEIEVSKFRYYVLPNNELNIDLMPLPLLYNFSTQEYISSIVNQFENIHEEISDKVYLARVETQKQLHEEQEENRLKENEKYIENQLNYVTKSNEFDKKKTRKTRKHRKGNGNILKL
jgi:hypothetical protein